MDLLNDQCILFYVLYSNVCQSDVRLAIRANRARQNQAEVEQAEPELEPSRASPRTRVSQSQTQPG